MFYDCENRHITLNNTQQSLLDALQEEKQRTLSPIFIIFGMFLFVHTKLKTHFIQPNHQCFHIFIQTRQKIIYLYFLVRFSFLIFLEHFFNFQYFSTFFLPKPCKYTQPAWKTLSKACLHR